MFILMFPDDASESAREGKTNLPVNISRKEVHEGMKQQKRIFQWMHVGAESRYSKASNSHNSTRERTEKLYNAYSVAIV